MDPRRLYATEPPPTGKRSKSKPTFKSFEEDPRFAPAINDLRALKNGLRAIENELEALRIDNHLQYRPLDPRAALMKQRREKHRSTVPPKPEVEASASALAPDVAAALALIRDGSRPAPRIGRQAAIEQLEKDRALVEKAIYVQTPIVDELRGEFEVDLVKRVKAQYAAMSLRLFRAQQTAAAITDEKLAFRQAFVATGARWREDLLPSPSLGSALVLGSEDEWDSEISRARRFLEDRGALK